MDTHICNRNTCSTKAVGGPKMNCVECDKECFLLCYGFEKCGVNAVKLPLLHGACIGLDPNLMSFTCAKCDNVLIDDAVSNKMEQMANKLIPTLNSRETQTKYPSPSMIRMADDLADLKSIVCEMKRKMDEPRAKIDLLSNVATTTSGSQNYSSSSSKGKISYADILNADRLIRTPKRNKESMIAANLTEKQKLLRPPSKVGTRADTDSLVVVANVLPKLSKSIYVSRVSTSVTQDKMVSFIEKHSDMKKNTDFKCSLLVKKGADLSLLTFVSFKIDVTVDHFDRLMQENFWPKGIQIRPFVPKERKSVNLGDFLNSSGNESHHPNKIPRANDEKDEVLLTNVEKAKNDPLTTNADTADLMDFQNADQHIKTD